MNAQAKSPENYEYLESIRYEPEMDLTMRAFGLAVAFLQSNLLAEGSLKFFKFYPLPIICADGEQAPIQKYMILDG